MRLAWILPMVLLGGCQQDVLLLLGDPTGMNIARHVQNTAELAAASTTAILIRPGEPERTAEAAVEQKDMSANLHGSAAAEGALPPVEFNPISVPQDAPEGTGVRWEGVKQKGTGRPPPTVRERNGRPVD
jgi:hypothetical protein